MSVKRRRFGRIRRLPSGRFQARYQLGDGRLRSAPTTFATEAEADRYLATVETDLARGTWFDPDAGEIRLDDNASRWLTERPVELQPRTAEIYRHLLRRHIYPTFGASPLNRITSAAVRSWNAALRESNRCRRCDRSTRASVSAADVVRPCHSPRPQRPSQTLSPRSTRCVDSSNGATSSSRRSRGRSIGWPKQALGGRGSQPSSESVAKLARQAWLGDAGPASVWMSE
jgi:hypothetical protein